MSLSSFEENASRRISTPMRSCVLMILRSSFGQRAGFQEDRVRHAQFAHVVQQPGDFQDVDTALRTFALAPPARKDRPRGGCARP